MTEAYSKIPLEERSEAAHSISRYEQNALEQYKLRILQENARDGGFALLMACISYAALLANHIDASLVIPWLMSSIAIVAIRFTLIARYFRASVAEKSSSFKRTVAINVVLMGLLGTAFGITPIFYGFDNHLMLSFSNLWCAGIVASLFVSQGIAPVVAYAFTVPSLGPLLGVYLLSGNLNLVLVGLGNLLLLGFLQIFSGRIRNAFLEEVTHRTKYERLAAHYEEQKAKSEYLVEELSAEVERRKDVEILLRKSRDEAENKSNQDHLTGLSNRRVFDKVLAREWFRGMRNRKPISLVFCTIDAFTEYNQRYGTHAADQCVLRIAQTIFERSKRAGDFVARYGSEEFALLLPGTPEMPALEIAEGLRQAVYERTILHAGSPVERVVTASFGVATIVPEEQFQYTTLIKVADNALNQARRSGGNCVVTVDGNRTFEDHVPE
ncbi:MAG: GGDEF domain-containing protein [Gammaproteobacteria bacterium]